MTAKDRNHLWRRLLAAGVQLSGYTTSDSAVLTVESFAAMQMHELYAGQPSVSELTKTVMSPAMQVEIRAYNKHTLDRKSRGAFDARSIDIDAEIKHANACAR